MKTLKKRIKRLENPDPSNTLSIERVIIDSKEQSKHPERFKRVLEWKDETRTVYNLEPVS